MTLQHRHKWLWTIVAVALLARIAYFVGYLKTPLSVWRVADQDYYSTWAKEIAGGNWLGTEVFEQGPLYAYGLAVLYRLGADDNTAIALQLLCGVATCVLVYLCANRLFEPRTACIAGLLCAIYGPLVFYECTIMKGFLSPLLTMLALYAALRFGEAGNSLWLFAGGSAIGLACLVRENHFLLLVPVAAWTWMRAKAFRFTKAARLVSIGLTFAFCGLMMLPSLVRNYVVSGELVLVTAGGGEVFYMGHGPEATGYLRPPDFTAAVPGREHEDFREEAQRRSGRKLSRSESSQFWFREAFREIVKAPAQSIKLTATKTAIVLNNFEVPDNSIFTATRAFIPLLWVLPGFGCIAGPGLAGIVVCCRHLGAYVLPLGFVAAHVLSVLLTYNLGRYRLGMMPVWILLAAHGTVWLVAAWRQTAKKGILTPLTMTLLGIGTTVAAFLSPAGYDAARSGKADRKLRQQIVNFQHQSARAEHLKQKLAEKPDDARAHLELGLSLINLEQPNEALSHFREAIRYSPSLAEAHYALGVTLENHGEPEESHRHLKEALQLKPDYAAAHLTVGKLSLNHKAFPTAQKHFEQAVQLNADDAEPHLWLGIVHNLQRQFPQAVAELKKALEIDSEYAEAYYYLARVYAQQGRLDEAIQQLTSALRAEPGFPDAYEALQELRDAQKDVHPEP